jgi:predicted dehydrogenase
VTTPLRIGILGSGKIAERALLVPAKEVPEVRIEAVGSRTADRARAYATQHGIATGQSYEELLANPAIDIVYITLPPSLHAMWSIRALEAGKHVLCEKPMTANEAEARQVAQAVHRSDRVYMEAFHFPYHPFARRVRDLLDTGALGDIREAEATFQIPGQFITPGNIRLDYRLGGGALMDAGCYPLRALRGFLGEVVEVREAQAETSPADRQVDMAMRATLGFANGQVGRLHASFLAKDKPDVRVSIRGARGALDITSLYVPQWGGALRLEWGKRVYTEQADPTPSYFFQLKELVRCIRDGAPVLTSVDDGVRNMAAIDAIYRKAGLPPRGSAAV